MIVFPFYFAPTREFVERLQEGDIVPDCFGKHAKVVKIFGRGDDLNGKAYVCFTTEFGERSTVSGSLKEGELHRNTQVTRRHTSAELREIERQINRVGSYVEAGVI